MIDLTTTQKESVIEILHHIVDKLEKKQILDFYICIILNNLKIEEELNILLKRIIQYHLLNPPDFLITSKYFIINTNERPITVFYYWSKVRIILEKQETYDETFDEKIKFVNYLIDLYSK